MARKFLVAVALLAALSARDAFAFDDTSSTVAVIPGTENYAARIFLGSERDMPRDGRFDMAMRPSMNGAGAIDAPRTVAGAFKELKKALPPWYLDVLAKSRGSNLCTVDVDRDNHGAIDYTLEVASWYWINWQLASNHSSLRAELNSWGVDEEGRIGPALEMGFCRYVKSRDLSAAIKIVRSYGRHE